MAKYIYLLRYNNYFNRTVKGYKNATVDGYIDDGAALISVIPNCTLWNPGDGVDTTLTSKIDMYTVPDYCVVCDEAKNVLNRWFVVEATRIQGGQYRLRLHRDLITDSYFIVMQNPDTYVERGYCDVSNDSIYNSESMTFNQIKKEQIQLFDQSGTPWIVGYISFPDRGTIESKTITFTTGYTVKHEYQFTIPASGMYNTDGVPYYIFAMPYEACTVTYGATATPVLQKSDVSLGAAMALSETYSGSGALLDLQLLPYCPNQTIIKGYRNIVETTNLIQRVAPIEIKTTGSNPTTAGYIYTVPTPSTSGICYEIYSLEPEGGTGYSTRQYKYAVNDIKTESQTRFHRIISPNGNGCWEYVPAKEAYYNSNNAKYGLTFQMTCKPFQPYIKVEPSFTRMYGGNYDDTRGLICGGDYSLPQISDAWKTYEIQNKNYQAMFNRNIESLDLQNKWAERQDIVNAATGTLTAVLGGITGGTMAGGSIGAVVGGVALGAASAAAGVTDVYANRALRADQRDNMITQENLRRSNIRALPQTITKATNFNVEMPLVPYLEVYDCSDNEKADLAHYLALKSYTINRYGALIDYKKPNGRTWLQGTLIKINGVDDDAHYVAALADEVHQGFYVGEEDV